MRLPLRSASFRSPSSSEQNHLLPSAIAVEASPPLPKPCPTADGHPVRPPASHQTIRSIAVQASAPKYRRPQSHPSPATDRQTTCHCPPTKPSAHKRPVDRPVGLRVCRCRYRCRPLADVPKERAAIQLPESKRPFPERRAAWGWLAAAAFHPANPQPEASAGFLVPFSKKGTSYMRRHSSSTHPAILFPILRPHAIRDSTLCYSFPAILFPSSFVIRDSFIRHSLHTTFRPKDRERLLATKLSTSTRRHWFTLPQPDPTPDR